MMITMIIMEMMITRSHSVYSWFWVLSDYPGNRITFLIANCERFFFWSSFSPQNFPVKIIQTISPPYSMLSSTFDRTVETVFQQGKFILKSFYSLTISYYYYNCTFISRSLNRLCKLHHRILKILYRYKILWTLQLRI